MHIHARASQACSPEHDITTVGPRKRNPAAQIVYPQPAQRQPPPGRARSGASTAARIAAVECGSGEGRSPSTQDCDRRPKGNKVPLSEVHLRASGDQYVPQGPLAELQSCQQTSTAHREGRPVSRRPSGTILLPKGAGEGPKSRGSSA